MNRPIIAIPGILDELALAGSAGCPLPADPVSRRDLDLCHRWGYPLRFEQGRVFLDPNDDSLVPEWVRRDAPSPDWGGGSVYGFLELDSTNEEALRLARGGAPEGTLVYAECQTAGRGRKGKSWISPAGAGIYCTLVVRPAQPRESWPLLTHAASLALVQALRGIADACAVSRGLEPDIKWPNDVRLSGRKTAGILLETTAVPGRKAVAVVGVGINVRPAAVPPKLEQQATCVDREAGAQIPRRKLLAAFLRHFRLCCGLFERGAHGQLLSLWKECCAMWTGTPVWVEDGGGRRPAVTCGLTELGALCVRNEDGTTETLLAGDVSIRPV